MSAAGKSNLAASVRQRLLTLGQRRGEPFDLILMHYGIERLLYRLSRSDYADRFLLKGAMLFRVWKDFSHRPTRDLDLLGFSPPETKALESIFRRYSVFCRCASYMRLSSGVFSETLEP